MLGRPSASFSVPSFTSHLIGPDTPTSSTTLSRRFWTSYPVSAETLLDRSRSERFSTDEGGVALRERVEGTPEPSRDT